MRKRGVTIAVVALAATGAWLGLSPSYASSTLSVNVSDLVRQSTRIIVGAVSAVNQVHNDGQLPYTEIQLEVAEAIRGDARGTFTFRQFGLQSAQPAVDGRRYVGLVAGMPSYKVGDQVVLFLGPTSSLGFSTTIGLQQGAFKRQGLSLANAANNNGLFEKVSFAGKRLNDKEQYMVTTKQGAVDADTFVNLVRRAVGERWWDAPRTKPPKKGTSAVGGTRPATLPTGPGGVQ